MKSKKVTNQSRTVTLRVEWIEGAKETGGFAITARGYRLEKR